MTSVVFRPGVLNVRSVRGDTVALPITIQEDGVPADLTGRVYAAQLRRSKQSTTAVEIAVGTADAADGILVLGLDAAVTVDLSGSYVWDLEQDLDGVTRTVLAGKWRFNPDVTRPVAP
jgi:hypothetical protein